MIALNLNHTGVDSTHTLGKIYIGSAVKSWNEELIRPMHWFYDYAQDKFKFHARNCMCFIVCLLFFLGFYHKQFEQEF